MVFLLFVKFFIDDEDKVNTITMIDFKNMDKETAKINCDNNHINCSFIEEYSNDIPKGEFISQSIAANNKVREDIVVTIKFSLGKKKGSSNINSEDDNSLNNLTSNQKEALESALSYLDTMAFSYKGLVEQLEYDDYSHEDAVYAADNCDADWNEQAVRSAKEYLDTMAFSRNDLIEQLEYEGFTHEQAVYGVTQNGY